MHSGVALLVLFSHRNLPSVDKQPRMMSLLVSRRRCFSTDPSPRLKRHETVFEFVKVRGRCRRGWVRGGVGWDVGICMCGIWAAPLQSCHGRVNRESALLGSLEGRGSCVC